MDRVCQFYLRGRCNRSNCEFKHVKPSEGGSGSSSIYRKTPCRFFEANGSCRFGDNCRFFHDAASNLRETRSKVSKAIVDSDEDLPLGIESEDEESNVSGFTDCNTIVGKRARKTPGGSDALKEAKSADSSASGTPLARKTSGANDESLISDSMPKTPSGTPHLKIPSPKNLVVARKSLPKAIEELSNISEEEEEEEMNQKNAGLKDDPKATNPSTRVEAPTKENKKSAEPMKKDHSSVSENASSEGTSEDISLIEIPKKRRQPQDKGLPLKKPVSNGPFVAQVKAVIAAKGKGRGRPKKVLTSLTVGKPVEKSKAPSKVEEDALTYVSSEWTLSTYDHTSDEDSDSPVPERTSTRIKKRLIAKVPSRSSNKSKANNSATVRCQACKFKRYPKKACRRCDKLKRAINHATKPILSSPPVAVVKGAKQSLDNTEHQGNGAKPPLDDIPISQAKETLNPLDNLVSQANGSKRLIQNSESPVKGAKQPLDNPVVQAKGTKQPLDNSMAQDKGPNQPISNPVAQVKHNKQPLENKTENKKSMPHSEKPGSLEANKPQSSPNPSKTILEEIKKPSPLPPTIKGLELPKFDPSKFKPGYIPPIVKNGDTEYAVVVTGVKNTGLCGKYWGDLDNLPPRRKRVSKLPASEEDAPPPPLPSRPLKRKESSPVKLTQISRDMSKSKSSGTQGASERKRSPAKTPSKKFIIASKNDEDCPMAVRSRHVKQALFSSPSPKKASSETQKDEILPPLPLVSSDLLSTSSSSSSSAVMPMNQERFAPYDDNRWFDIGKELFNSSPDAVQYTRSLRLPYHLLSFLRIKGHSAKGVSCTDKNNMVFVVIEGEVSIETRSPVFEAKKGDSFFIPPQTNYNILNKKAREAELCIFQFAHEDSIPTAAAETPVESKS